MSLAETEQGVLERLGISVSRVGLQLPLGLSYEDYTQVCTFIGELRERSDRARSTINWMIADAFIQGEKLFGDDVYQAAELLHRSPSTIQNIISVGRKVPFSRRRENVDFTHHAEVTKLSPNDQRHWLKVAEEDQLPKSELRARIQAQQNGEVLPPATEICSECGRPL